MDFTQEVQNKLERARALMQQHRVETLWLRTVNNVSWITGGVDTAINTADNEGIASVVITADRATIWTNSIEAPRLRNEDHVEDRGFELRSAPWHGPLPLELDSALACDVPYTGAKDLGGELAVLRAQLLLVEIERFRTLGSICAEGMQRAINRVKPGHTEYEIAAALEYETYSRGVRPVVALVATDERIFGYRHPLPTDKIMEKYAMLVLCGRKDGLTCSVTRLVHFGALPDDLKRKQQAVAEVDAAIQAASQPGVTMGEMFDRIKAAYARVGFPDEEQLHHQGGIAGYGTREALALPGSKVALAAGMTCAWNPSITGTKCEDTTLVTEAGQPTEILTRMFGWPTAAVEVDGMTYERPLILEIV